MMLPPDHPNAISPEELLKLYDKCYPDCIDRKANNLVVGGDRIVCIHDGIVEWEMTVTQLTVEVLLIIVEK